MYYKMHAYMNTCFYGYVHLDEIASSVRLKITSNKAKNALACNALTVGNNISVSLAFGTGRHSSGTRSILPMVVAKLEVPPSPARLT